MFHVALKVPLVPHRIDPPNREPSWQFFLPALLICKFPNVEKQVTFLVDTGAMYTSLQDKDVKRLKIQYSDLTRKPEAEWTRGIGTKVETYVMADVRFLLLSEDRKQVVWEKELAALDVLRHPPEDYEKLRDCPSLLGMDVLSEYRLMIDVGAQLAFIEVPSL